VSWTDHGPEIADRRFTPTTNASNCTVTGRAWRLGDSLELQIMLLFTGSSSFSGALTIDWSSLGLTVDSTRIAGAPPLARIRYLDISAGIPYWGTAVVDSTTITLQYHGTTNRLLDTSSSLPFGAAYTSPDQVWLHVVDVPIREWRIG
jgi:hypothetical protein